MNCLALLSYSALWWTVLCREASHYRCRDAGEPASLCEPALARRTCFGVMKPRKAYYRRLGCGDSSDLKIACGVVLWLSQ